MDTPFEGFYSGKKVLVTGDSGFKGSWLAIWLTHLGANVIGYSLDPPTDPSNFAACKLSSKTRHYSGDILDYQRLCAMFAEARPDIVFHLAAQPLVRLSFEQARYTFGVNVMGTVNALEAARQTDSVQAVVCISSDKCYRNVGWEWGYRESDQLGGHDPYSASKACAELAIAVYQDIRFQHAAKPWSDLAIASTRAGNVIAGGDWAEDRIIPDTIRAITSQRDIVVRNRWSTRPWQHVLEPLSAYLWLGVLLARDRSYCSSWNIGPSDVETVTVGHLVDGVLKRWPSATRIVFEGDPSEREAKLLKLDCSKANHLLKWRAAWPIDRTLDAIVAWCRHYYTERPDDMYDFTVSQIEAYTQCARAQGIPWASPASPQLTVGKAAV